MKKIFYIILFISMSFYQVIFASPLEHSLTGLLVAHQGPFNITNGIHRQGLLWQTHLNELAVASGTILDGKLRAYAIHDIPLSQSEIAIRQLFILHQKDKWQIKGGLFETTTFSETFDSHLLDVVHPLDRRFYMYEEYNFQTLPQWLAIASYFAPLTTIDLFFSPLPKSQIYPTKNSELDPLHSYPSLKHRTRKHPDTMRPFREMEYGLKVSHSLTPSTTLGAIAYHHHSRDMVYKTFEPTSVEETQKEVNSLGASLKLDLYEGIVFTGESLFTVRDTIQRGPYHTEIQNHWKSVLQLHKQSEEDLFFVGVQLHYDQRLNQYWAAIKASTDWNSGHRFETGSSLFQNIRSLQNDTVIKAWLNYNGDSWNLENTLTIVQAKGDEGRFWAYHDYRQWSTHLTWFF